MGNPYPVDFLEPDGSVRLGGAINFTDQSNQPGGGSQPDPLLPFAFDTPGLFAQSDDITAVDQGLNTFTVAGDRTARYPVDSTFKVAGSTGNDGSYAIAAVTFTGGNTVIDVTPTSPPDATVDGVICNYAAFGVPIYTPTVGALLALGLSVTTTFDGADVLSNSPHLLLYYEGTENWFLGIALDTADSENDGPQTRFAVNFPYIEGIIVNEATPFVAVVASASPHLGAIVGNTQGAGAVIIARSFS